MKLKENEWKKNIQQHENTREMKKKKVRYEERDNKRHKDIIKHMLIN